MNSTDNTALLTDFSVPISTYDLMKNKNGQKFNDLMIKNLKNYLNF